MSIIDVLLIILQCTVIVALTMLAILVAVAIGGFIVRIIADRVLDIGLSWYDRDYVINKLSDAVISKMNKNNSEVGDIDPTDTVTVCSGECENHVNMCYNCKRYDICSRMGTSYSNYNIVNKSSIACDNFCSMFSDEDCEFNKCRGCKYYQDVDDNSRSSYTYGICTRIGRDHPAYLSVYDLNRCSNYQEEGNNG